MPDNSPDSRPMPRARIGQARAFWIVNTAGWLAYAVVTFLAALPLTTLPASTVFVFKLGWASAGLVVSLALRVVYVRYNRRRPSLARLATVAVIGSAIGAPVWLLAHRVAAEIASGGEVVFLEWVYVPRILADHFATLLIWSGAFLAASHWRDARDRERKAVEGTALAHQAQLELLRYQLNPHFLFNALASIRALVLTDPATAHRMITAFSELLRASLRRPTSARVALADEVAMARRYLDIETMRFGDALDTTFVIPREADAALVPEFILQPLVENAIKHGKPAPNRVLTVTVSAAVVGSSLALEVANTGSLGPARSGGAPSTADGDRTGIGLQIVRARLESEYPGTHGFDLEQDGAFVRARVRLPLLRA